MSDRPSRAEVRRRLRTPTPRPTTPGDHRLTVVIPAYHEADGIGPAIGRVRHELAAVDEAGGLEIVVVDDGSGDGTAEAARDGGADQVVAQPVNRGKGAAVRAGVAVARGRTIAFTDADLSYAPAQIERLLREVEAGWDVVVGNRHHEATTTVVRAPRLRELGNRAINLATRAVLVGGHADTQCGLKAFRSDVARILFEHGRIDGFAFDVELFHLAERYGFAIEEVPVEVANTASSTVRVARDAARLLVDLARIRRLARTGAYALAPEELARLSPSPGGG